MLLFKLTGEPSKAEYQAPRALMTKAQRSVAKWVLAITTLMTEIKAMMTIFLMELQEPGIKAIDYLGPPFTASSTGKPVWQNWFAYF